MTRSRLEAFSDGVIAILITIMVLELKAPEHGDVQALTPLMPVFLAYVLSFVYLGIYWSNHHHMLQTVDRVNGNILWANMNLLFWLSLIPFTTAWMNNNFDPIPTAIYGTNLLLSGIAYTLLQKVIITSQGPHSRLARAIKRDMKGKISLLLYLISIPLAFVHQALSYAVYILVAIMWMIPDRRIEHSVQ